jgi:hypothetical protein
MGLSDAHRPQRRGLKTPLTDQSLTWTLKSRPNRVFRLRPLVNPVAGFSARRASLIDSRAASFSIVSACSFELRWSPRTQGLCADQDCGMQHRMGTGPSPSTKFRNVSPCRGRACKSGASMRICNCPSLEYSDCSPDAEEAESRVWRARPRVSSGSRGSCPGWARPSLRRPSAPYEILQKVFDLFVIPIIGVGRESAV